MDRTAHLAALRADGTALAAAAEEAGTGAPVPPCPEWRIRDLLRHLGGVYAWAGTIVTERLDSPPRLRDDSGLGDPPDGDAGLVDWFRDRHARLLGILSIADDEPPCWTLLPADTSGVAFWARRQALETAVHRIDAQSAVGPIAPFDPLFAADGVDELLAGFAPRPRFRLRSDPPRALHVHAEDVDRHWLLTVGPDAVRTERTDGPADLTLTGTASGLFSTLWNRPAAGTEPRSAGDTSLLDAWRELARIG